MKKVIFLITFVFTTNAVLAQSVHERIKAMTDTVPDLKKQAKLLRILSNDYNHSQAENRKLVGEYLMNLGKQLENDLFIAQGHEIVGSAMVYTDFPVALDNLLKAASIFESLDDKEWIAKVYASLAPVYQTMNEKEKAIASINKASIYAFQVNDSSMLSTIFTNKSAIHYHFKNIDSALHYGKIAIAYKKALGKKRGLTLMLLNLGVIMSEYDSLLDQSLAYLLEARESSGTDGIMISDVIANMIYIHYRRNEIDKSYAYVDSAVVALDSVDNDYTLQAVHRMAQELYSEFGVMDKAFEHLKLEYEMDKKLRGLEVQKKFEVLELNYENEKGLRQIAVLEKEKAQTQFKYTIAILIAFLMVLIAVLVYVITKRNAQIREKELTLELGHKKRELASYAMNFVQKNTLFGELKERINELHKKMGPDSAQEIKQIKGLIEDNHRADKEWENFKVRFEQVHEGFFSNLSRKFPDLGNAEVKLCALLRLNLNLKESSHVLGISPDSVKTARHRLRKKLGLSTEHNLVQFLTAEV